MALVNKVAVIRQEASQAPITLVSSLAMPILCTDVAFSDRCVAISARHIVSETTFTNINNGFIVSLVRRYLVLKDAPCGFVRFRMGQCFFYSSPQSL